MTTELILFSGTKSPTAVVSNQEPLLINENNNLKLMKSCYKQMFAPVLCQESDVQ